ncbi:carboxypeptidase-like regulatory domain-containing protein [Tautonia rosea]|uniref:carboxypeptidase-like regulatory domain-containing protein n=1 Tax=Tautonia rosea TaxID=2728037 RepID=UPI001473C3F6|nr:carboxypeptidase-like regulatory domain-containing protein [Tautonia rosea]
MIRLPFAFLGMLLIPSQVLSSDDRLVVVEGTAVFVGTDQPAAFVSLSFSQGGHPETTVTTDANGRFQWTPLRVLNLHAGPDGSNGPLCRVQVQDTRTSTWDIIHLGRGPLNESFRRRAEDQYIDSAETRWMRERGEPRLQVLCPPTGTSEIRLFSPDGLPLAHCSVELFPEGRRFGFHQETSARLSTQTDADGLLRLRWVEGMQRLRFIVPEIGFGATGWFEVVGGQTVQPQVPHLARFGEVQGRIAPGLIGKIDTVGIGETPWNASRAVCDADGRFSLRQVQPGPQTLRAFLDGQPVRVEQVKPTVVPGRRIEGLIVGPATERPPGVPHDLPGFVRRANENQEITWIEGIVTDTRGLPVSEAYVAVRAEFNTGMRFVGEQRSTTTDAHGNFRITGPFHKFTSTLLVIVSPKDKPPAVAYAPPPFPDTPDRPPLEITLADRGGTLLVTVLKDGRPLPNAGVRLDYVSPYGNLFPRTMIIGIPRAPDAVDPFSRIFPIGSTGPDGVVRFEYLLPGTYRIQAGEGQFPQARVMFPRVGNEAPVLGISEGIEVADGQTVAHSLSLQPRPTERHFRVLFPDGTPLNSRDFFITLPQSGSSSSFAVDDSGIGSHAFQAPGHHLVLVRFRDSKLHPNPDRAEPFYEATAQVAVSAAEPNAEPIPLRAVRRGPATLQVRLQNTDGQPARGTVLLVDWEESTDFAATTDETGLARFTELPSGSYRIRGILDGLEPPPIFTFSENPAAKLFRAPVAILGRAIELNSDDDQKVELRAEPVAYLDGLLLPRHGLQVRNDRVDVARDPARGRFEPSVLHDRETGRFRIGPLPVGTASLWITRAIDQDHQSLGPIDVELAQGINRLELAAPANTLASQEQRFPVPPSAARVFLENGEVPAFGARALLFSPSFAQPIGEGITDASGRLFWKGGWISLSNEEPAGRLPGPSVAVRLPGSNGAIVFRADDADAEAPRVVLPPPITVSGLVTIGGKPIGDRLGQIQVSAQHQGSGALSLALSLETTSRADGSFALSGLTPGRYLVQAARDQVWTSPSIELLVTDGEPLPDLALDIPEPGVPVLLQLVDANDRPAPDQPFRVVRSEGPYAARWPLTLRTDTTGSALLHGLETGTHTLQVKGTIEPLVIEVPPANDHSAGPLAVRAVLGNPSDE